MVEIRIGEGAQCAAPVGLCASCVLQGGCDARQRGLSRGCRGVSGIRVSLKSSLEFLTGLCWCHLQLCVCRHVVCCWGRPAAIVAIRMCTVAMGTCMHASCVGLDQ